MNRRKRGAKEKELTRSTKVSYPQQRSVIRQLNLNSKQHKL